MSYIGDFMVYQHRAPSTLAQVMVCCLLTMSHYLNNVDFPMMTSSNGNIFHVTGHLCGEFTSRRWIPRTKASDAGLWYFYDLRLNERLSKQLWGWWFEMLSRPLWCHCNAISEVLLHSPVSRFTVNTQASILYNECEKCTFKISVTAPIE